MLAERSHSPRIAAHHSWAINTKYDVVDHVETQHSCREHSVEKKVHDIIAVQIASLAGKRRY